MADSLNRWTAATCLVVAAWVSAAAGQSTPTTVPRPVPTTVPPAAASQPAVSPLAKFTTPLPPTWPVNQTIPGPCGVQLKDGNMSTGDVERVHQLGLKYVRRGFTWRAVEKEKGVYDFSTYERLVVDCRERGMSVLATLGLGNPLYGKVHVKDEPAHSAYVAYAAAAARKFKGQPVIFEIWNEPNVKFWGNYDKSNGPVYAADYTKLVMDTVPAMRKANPNVIVLGGSVSNVWTESYKWIDSCFKDGILESGIDAWSLHPYGVRNPEDYLIAYDIVHKSMTDNGKGRQIPFINSERGFGLDKNSEGYNGGAPSKDKEFQAWHLVRQYMVDQLCGVELTSWYEWSGKESFSLVEGERGERHFPAYDACKVMLQELDGYKFDRRLPTASELDFVLQWKNAKTGGMKLVAWTRPPMPAPVDKNDKTATKPKPITPDDAVAHAIEIPVSTTAAALLTADLYGKAGSAAVQDGKASVTISGAPVYVTVVPH